MAKRPTITVDLQNLKDDFVKTCKENNLSPSEVVRELVRCYLNQDNGQEKKSSPVTGELAPGMEGEGRERIHFRLRDSEAKLAMEHVKAYKYGTLNNWIIALIRASISNQPQLGQNEYEGLVDSNRQLLALGRNLNQIARVLNKGEKTDRITADRIQLLMDQIDKHTSKVSHVLAANVERWGVTKDGKDTS